jgi:enoyl-CoA hydratase/carnithine racemase
MTSLDEYASRYDGISFERTNGVVEIALHTGGEPLVFSEQIHHELGSAFADVAGDVENRVVILTGTGDRFCTDFDYGSFAQVINANPFAGWRRIRADGRRMLQAFLDIEVPVISAINGPVMTHSELPLLADVVLAAETTVFQDATHFISGLPPADGVHTVWTTLLGLNRGRYFLLTGERIGAIEAHRLGVVGEVLTVADLLPRARELAAEWAAKPLGTLHATRIALTVEWRRLLSEQLHLGLTHESLAAVEVGEIEMANPPVISLFTP